MTFEILTNPTNSQASLLFQQCLAEIVPENKLIQEDGSTDINLTQAPSQLNQSGGGTEKPAGKLTRKPGYVNKREQAHKALSNVDKDFNKE